MSGTDALITLGDAEDLARAAVSNAGASGAAASSTARALVAAEADGHAGHGLSRIPSYAAQLRRGKINGLAAPKRHSTASGVLRIDADGGLAYPALDMAVESLPALARRSGVAAVGVFASHHVGQAGRPVERLAEQGLVALIASNTPKAMAPWGGVQPLFGTNPLAFAAPLPDRAPLLIDLALTLVARSSVVAAQRRGESIPQSWATDRQGRPTTDPAAALEGALTPIGGAKGAALALMVEVLCAALVGGQYGWEASSFLDAEGPRPDVGQIVIAFDPEVFSGSEFPLRMGRLLRAFEDEENARLPGDARLAKRARAASEGLRLPRSLLADLRTLATPDLDFNEADVD
jgi:(2R)-3-sulfolactate dehydrogenase (NADP+)